ncbi:hypothetical protein D3C72_572210 [compost metagenome]
MPGGVGQHHRARRLIDTLSPDNLPIGVLLQELHHRLRFERQRARNRFLLVFGIERDKRHLALGQDGFKIQLLHDIGRGELVQVNNSHSV